MNSVPSDKKRGRFVLIALAAILLFMTVSSFLRNTRGGGGTATDFIRPSERRPFTPLQGTGISDSSPWRLNSLQGKIVLLNYAATWCPPCLRETPGLVSVSNRYRASGVEIVGLMMDEGSVSDVTAVVEQYARRYDIPYALVRPENDTLLLFTGLGLPTSILLDRQGRQVRSYLGPVSESVLRADIERILQEKNTLPTGHKS